MSEPAKEPEPEEPEEPVESETDLDPTSPDFDIEKVYGDFIWGKKTWKSRLIRNFYRPLWDLTSRDFRQFKFQNMPKSKRLKVIKEQADNLKRNSYYRNLPKRNAVVGRDKEFSIMLNSVYYHVLRHEIALKQRMAPPKVFLVKGEPGSGKSWLIQALMREAFDRAIEEGFVMNLIQLEGANVTGEFLGQLTRGVAAVFNQAATRPTFLYIDEAQSLVQKGSDQQGDSATREYQNMESAMLQALDRMIKRPIRSIVVFSTNAFEAIREDIRRRCFLVDLDTPGLKREDMAKIVALHLKKVKLKLDPEKVLYTLEQALRGIGEGKIVPHDISRAFESVVAESEKPLREAFLDKIQGADVQPLPITEDSFKAVAKDIRAYKDQQLVQSVKEAEQTVPPPERYQDVGGLRGIKDEVIKEVTLSLHPDKGGDRWIPPRGYLFFGPPGTGKTLLAKAVAGENKVPFFLVKGPSLLAGIVGESEKGVRQLFSRARAKAPSIIFVDEIDAIGQQRGRQIGGNAPVAESSLTALLNELDGFNPKGKVVFIGATNRRDMLDNALLERLDKQFDFTYPKTTEEKLDVVRAQWEPMKADSEVTNKDILKLFLKRTFSPRVCHDVIKEATRYSQLEQIACRDMLAAMADEDIEKGAKSQRGLRDVYREDFKRIQDRLTNGKREDRELAPEFDLREEYHKIAHDNPVILHHLETAFTKKAETAEDKEEREMQSMHRSKDPEIGKGYGLAVDGKEEWKGTMLIIECLIFPAAKENEGDIQVYGNAGKGALEAARMGRSFLRKFCPGIMKLDIELHIINPGEGGEEVSVSGPSAGMACLFTLCSALILEPFNPDVVMTGKTDLHGIVGLVGGIQPEHSAAKLDAARENGFRVCLIPDYAYQQLVKDFSDYLEMSREAGTQIAGGKTVWDYAPYVFPGLTKEQIIQRLAQAVTFN